jgi:tripartite-type tricarboxylate transporter receptor subunit TctC
MKNWLIRASVLLCCLTALAGNAAAQAYPNKPIQLVLGFPPGGSTDILARVVASKLQAAWGQPVVVLNKPGASTIIATEFVAKSPADGYTLLLGASSANTINPILYPKLSYSPARDFAPITIMGSFPLVLAVHPSVPASSVRELVALNKTRATPMNYSSASTLFQLAGEMFKQMGGIDLTHIPYKGSAQALTAMTAGDVQMLFLDPAPVIAQVKGGRAKALAVTSKKRWSLLPELPTMAESGMPDFDVTAWVGLFAPTGTPPDIQARLQVEVNRILQMPDVRERLDTLGIDPGGRALGIEPASNNAETLAQLIREEGARYAKVIKTANIKAE